MTASNSPTFDSSLSTRILKLESSMATPWVVCTLDAVPIILARFENLAAAEVWQQGLCGRNRAA